MFSQILLHNRQLVSIKQTPWLSCFFFFFSFFWNARSKTAPSLTRSWGQAWRQRTLVSSGTFDFKASWLQDLCHIRMPKLHARRMEMAVLFPFSKIQNDVSTKAGVHRLLPWWTQSIGLHGNNRRFLLNLRDGFAKYWMNKAPYSSEYTVMHWVMHLNGVSD